MTKNSGEEETPSLSDSPLSPTDQTDDEENLETDELLADPQVQELLEKSPQVATKILAVIQRRSFQGPIPPPDIIAEYENVLPGSAERILAMAENEQKHRHSKENKQITMDSREQDLDEKFMESEFKQSKRGQLLGAGMAVIALSIAAYLAMNNHPNVAGIIGGTTVIGLVSAFVIGKVWSNKLDSKEE